MRRAGDVPPIGWIIAGMAAVLVVSIASVVGLHVREERDLERRVREADSTARVHRLEAVILRRDAVAERARADALEERAAQADTVASALRRDLSTLGARAAASSAAVDRRALPPDVAQALADADTFRLAVTPALVQDSLRADAWRATADRFAHAYELQAQAYAEQGAALVARDIQVVALERQAHPRCGRRCGIALGAIAALTVHELPRVVRALLSPSHP